MNSKLTPSRLLASLLIVAILVVATILIRQSYRLINAQALPPTRAIPTLAVVAKVDVTATPSAEPSSEIVPTATSTSTSTLAHSPTPGPSPTPTHTLTPTSIPTKTPMPTSTPTSIPQLVPTLSVTGVGKLREGVPTPATIIPSPVPTYEVPLNTTNILLLGSDTPVGTGDARSDTMIIVSINRTGPTASMVSLPRDLYVYIPTKTMNRLNTAVSQGNVDLLKQAILYNFGIPIHYYARIDFEGFKAVLDAIDGIDVNVSCRFQDWRLKSPELDPENEDNWAQFALEPGVHHMDGDLALWYARSRLSTNDFDRGRRQQQLLRAMLNQGVDLGLIAQVPTLWSTFQEYIDTDIDIGRLLQLASLAPAIRENGVQHLYLAGKTESWTVPTSGAFVHLPIWEGSGMMQETLQRLFLPPALSKATRPPIQVEIINATEDPDLAILAADNLAWYGFVPVITSADTYPGLDDSASTNLRYYGPNFKGSYDWLISWIFNQRRSQIELISEETHPFDYQVIIGEDYDPCLDQFYAPQVFLNP